MALWIVAGYCLTAVLFYSYLVATAQPEPNENAGVMANTDRTPSTQQTEVLRKAA